MDESELLRALDRRAGRAVDALDRRLAGVEPAPLPIESQRARRPAWLPLLVAAGLVVVALVGIGFALDDRDDEQGTVADDREAPVETGGGLTRLALADPAALGFSVRAAFDGTTVAGEPGLADRRFLAHGAAGAHDPWGEVVLTGTVPIEEYTFMGELVDVGGPEAAVLTIGPMSQLVWRDGDIGRQLIATQLDRDELVRLAARATAASWDGEGALPGYELLHAGTYRDFFPTLAFAAGIPAETAGIAYDDLEGDRDFVIAWTPGGDEATWRALHALSDSRAIDVRGRTALTSSFGMDDLSQVSWLEDDGTIVEVVLRRDVEELLPVLADALTPIAEEQHRALLAAHPAADDQLLLDVPVTPNQPAEGVPPVATVRTRDQAGTTYSVQVVEQQDGGLALMEEVDDGTGISGSGGPLRDLETPFLQAGGTSRADGGPTTPMVVSGLIPPGVADDLASTRFVNRTTGAEVGVMELASSPIPGAGSRLVIALLDADPATARIDVTFQTADGERTWRL